MFANLEILSKFSSAESVLSDPQNNSQNFVCTVSSVISPSLKFTTVNFTNYSRTMLTDSAARKFFSDKISGPISGLITGSISGFNYQLNYQLN